MRLAAISSLWLCAALGAFGETPPPRVQTSFDSARSDAAALRFSSALLRLDTVLTAEPGHVEARLLRARIHAWQGKHAQAGRELSDLHREHPGDIDVRLAQGYLLYYQGRHQASIATFEAVLAERPRDAEASEGLRRAREAAALHSRPWRVDAGGEYSTFTRSDQTDWNQLFLQVGRSLRQARTSWHLRAERYRQFELTDAAFEAGLSHRFSDAVYASAAAGWTPAADFKPEWRAAGDAGYRVWTDPRFSAWLLAAAWFDAYSSLNVLRVSPGLRLERSTWALTGRLTRVDAGENDPLYGWLARVEGPLLLNDARFYAGYGDAPETVLSTTVATRSLFGGVSLPLGEALTAQLGYTRDDREDAYVRHALNASLSQRF